MDMMCQGREQVGMGREQVGMGKGLFTLDVHSIRIGIRFVSMHIECALIAFKLYF